MALSTVYKGTSEYRDPNTGTIYVDGAGGKKASSTAAAVNNSGSAAGSLGSSGTYTAPAAYSSSSYKAKSTNYTPYEQSDDVRSLRSQSEGYADQVDSMSYSPSALVKSYQAKMADTENNKPDAYVNRWAETQNNLLEEILNEKAFSYTGSDLMNDDMYKMYSEMYEKNARKAMNNAMGEAASLTGGYGSTYSQAAGQQAYDDTMSNMNEIALTLADKAYEKYLNDRSNRYDKLSAVNTQEQSDYGKYRDEVGDWQLDRDYYAGRYDSIYGQDYQKYQDEVEQAQYLANLYASLYGQASSDELSAWQANRAADEYESSYALSKAADDRDAEKWSYEKQLLALQVQQAQQAAAEAAAGGSGSGSGRGKGKDYDSSLPAVTTADITHFMQSGATADEIKEGIAISKKYYANNSNLTAEQKAKAQKVLAQYEALAGRKKSSSK